MDIKIPYLLNDVKRASKRRLFTVISTFAGGGGSSTGYKLAGGNILAVNEFVESARDTYLANYPGTLILPNDIRELTGKDFLKATGLKKGELDILDGSPPCASFSLSGSREKSWGKEKKYSNTTQRVDDLFFEYARIIKEIQPKVFIAENVKGLTVGIAKNILGFKAKTLFPEESPTIIKSLQACGYIVNWKVLNSADYGVPQTRERIIIIGVRKDIGISPTFPKRTIKKWITFEEACHDCSDTPRQKNSEGIIWDYLCKCKPGQSVSDIHPKGHGFNSLRIKKDYPCPTILQSGNAKLMHWKEDRYLSIPECIRIMGFPDNYILKGNVLQQWERLGRSVAPLMYKAVSEHIYETVLKEL